MSRTRTPNAKKDITLMTVLANEATADSRKLLKKYGVEDAKNYSDLEVKLAQLYFQQPDKVTIEKELAEIHPHKNWILKNSKPVVEIKEEVVIVEDKKSEEKSNAEGTNLSCPCNCPCRQQASNFFGPTETNNKEKNQNFEYFGLIGLVAVVGLTFYVLNKTVK